MCLFSPCSALGAEESAIGSPRANFMPTRASNRCDSGQNKTHIFAKREQIYSFAKHKCPALMQSVFRAVSTSCQVGRGLAGHPQCVRVGNGYDKMRLYTPLPQCARHHSAQRGHSSPPRRGDESAAKKSHNMLLQTRASRASTAATSSSPKKTLACDLKRSFRMITLKQILLQICAEDWFMMLDLKDAYSFEP